ncbi:MAG: ribosome silencing factor [Proteobacteria bacterium]|nr:ribosome silencing factor [Pseudomonadota bacterium]MDA0983089.1 ribosome silencing factor [Pseudomonadota bacterium]
MDIRKKQRAVVEALEDIKGRDIVVFNVAQQTAEFERVVIASGDSNRQVNALANSVQEKLKALGARIKSVEGRRNGEWALVDLGDIVVHVMHPAVRSHYNLEELWGGKEVKLKTDAPKQMPKAKPKARPKPKAKPKPRQKPRRTSKSPARAKAAPRRRRK